MYFFLGIRCLWVILRWHSDRPPTLHPSAAFPGSFPGPSPHAVQESARKPRLLPKAQLAHALGEPGCLLGTRRSLSAPIPKPQEVSSTSTPPPGLPCSIARLLMHKPFATATCGRSPAARLDLQHLLLYPTQSPIASFSIVSFNQPAANPIHA